MASIPQSQSPQLLSQQEIIGKFGELNMLPRLYDTCFIRRIKPLKSNRSLVTTSLSIVQRRKWEKKWGWRAESFIRNVDDRCMAIIHWRKNLLDEEEMKVEQFEAPDGTWYVVDTVRHPQPGVSSQV